MRVKLLKIQNAIQHPWRTLDGGMSLLIRRMDVVAVVYRLAASMSPGIDGVRSRVEFHRRGRFDAIITLHDGRSFGVVRQGLALRRRSLYDRLRAIAQYDHWRRPDTVLILTPSAWELRRTARFCINNDLRDCFIAVESRAALERRDLRIWCEPTGLFGLSYSTLETVSSHGRPGGGPRTASPERKRASLPRPERMAQAAPAFGVSPSEKRTLDVITDHPMIPREHLALWLGVSEGRVSQMMRNLVNTWGLVERQGKRGDTRYTLSAEGIRYVSHRDRAQLPTTQGIWSTALTTDKQGRRRHAGTPHRDVGEADEARRRHHVVPVAASGRSPCGPRQRVGVVRPHRQVRPNLQLGGFGHRTGRNWADDRPGPSDTVLLRVRASSPSPQGSPGPPETLQDRGPPGSELEDGGSGPAPGAVDW